MTHPVARILEELRDDHRNMAMMLTLLEQEAGRIDEGDEPDYELLHDIMHYMTVYSDAVHHPKEDLIYAKLQSECTELASGLERIPDDHREIAELSKTLRDDIESIVSGTAVTRDRVINDTIDYVRRLRQHMAWEDDDLFVRADRFVAESTSASIDVSQLDIADPVFGHAPQAAFDNLLRSIRNAAAEPHS